MRKFLHDFQRDIQSFCLVHPHKGIVKYFYFPDVRTVLIFRLSQLCHRYRLLRFFSHILTLLNDFLAGVWIGPKATIGPGLFLGHARGLVINPSTIIGDNFSVLNGVTIGGPNVVIGNNVEVNAGAIIVSNLRGKARLSIGNNVIIGAGAVVGSDIPDCSLVMGNPGRVINKLNPEDNWVDFRKARNSSLCQ